jgi:hypothetical protein
MTQAADALTALPPELADLLRPELPTLADLIVGELGECIPEFSSFMNGEHRGHISARVQFGLRQFVDQIGGSMVPLEHNTRMYQRLGRAEYVAGRSLDGLQAAFRVGARVAWRYYAQVGRQAGLEAGMMYMLAENVFNYVEQVASHSVSGYADLRARATGDVERKRRRLLELLLADPPIASAEQIADLARAAAWTVPARAAVVALDEPWRDNHAVSPAVPPDVLMDLERPDPVLLVPDADGPGKADLLRRAFVGARFSVGPSVPLADAPLSRRMAGQALSLARRGILGDQNPIRCDENLATLLLLQDERIMRLLIDRNMAPFAGLTPASRERLTETLYAWLVEEGRIVEAAANLSLHPQTVRYRMRRLETLFGDRLHDPGWRFEMEMALRSRMLLL